MDQPCWNWPGAGPSDPVFPRKRPPASKCWTRSFTPPPFSIVYTSPLGAVLASTKLRNWPSPLPRPPQVVTTPRVSASAGAAIAPMAIRTTTTRWTMRPRVLAASRPRHVRSSSADDDRLAPGEVADGDGAGLDAGGRRRAGVLGRPRRAALDARGVPADDVELAVGLGLEEADRAPPGAAALAGRRAAPEAAALERQVGAQRAAALQRLGETKAPAGEVRAARPAAAPQRDG